MGLVMPIPSIDLSSVADLEHRAEVLKARQHRLDLLARKHARRRATRSRIILGGAILAHIRDNPNDAAFLRRIISILDVRVFLPRDRDDLRAFLGLPLPLDPATAPIASTAIPDFASLAKLAVRIPKSVADRDPDLADVRHPTDDRS